MGGSARTEGVDAIVIGSQTRGWCRSGANLGTAPILPPKGAVVWKD